MVPADSRLIKKQTVLKSGKGRLEAVQPASCTEYYSQSKCYILYSTQVKSSSVKIAIQTDVTPT